MKQNHLFFFQRNNFVDIFSVFDIGIPETYHEQLYLFSTTVYGSTHVTLKSDILFCIQP